ncbi:MAG: CaiB/BaiF CoA transferase family protein [Vicinamibacterales bacterium]
MLSFLCSVRHRHVRARSDDRRDGIETPLGGIAVVDFTRYLPGPYCTRLLADLGAAVVKVEPPGGDPLQAHAMSWYEQLNAGKQVVRLDLRDEAARRRLDGLLGAADVCVEGFRPSTARALGVDAAALRARHPRLVHCSITGYGQTGPAAERAGHDLNYQGEAGLLGHAHAVPPHLMADITAALHAALGILAALVERGRTRRGADVAVSLVDAARAWMSFAPPPILGGAFACYNVYETADRQWLALGALERKFWARFCQGVGRPDWIARQFDPEPARSLLVGELRALFLARDRDAWLRALDGIDCCLSAIRAP